MTILLRDILKIALPVSLENIIANTGTFVITVFLSQLGEVAVAINGVANQGLFLVMLFLFGLNTGGAIFIAQYWGKKDMEGIRKTTSLMIGFSLLISIAFFVFTFFFPKVFIKIFSSDVKVIENGVLYLRIISISYFGLALEMSFRTFLRAIEKATIPMMSYLYGTLFQTIFAFVLLKGVLGFPKLGLTGIALTLTLSRFFIPLYQILKAAVSKLPFTFSFKDITAQYLKKFLEIATPTTLNEIFWSLGMTAYGVIFGKMGTQAYAARSILSSFENYVWTFTLGVVVAASVFVGKFIGQMEYEKALNFGKKVLFWNAAIGFISSIVVVIIYYLISPTFEVEESTKLLLTSTMWVMAIGAPIKAFNGAAIVGVLRSGGDAKFAFLLETLTLWCLGVPLAFLGAFIWKQPLPIVYLLTLSDEIVKAIIAYVRINSKKWIKNVTISEEIIAPVGIDGEH
ncbi:MAG: MATE family efflux transporter [Fervidobacterium sp.]